MALGCEKLAERSRLTSPGERVWGGRGGGVGGRGERVEEGCGLPWCSLDETNGRLRI